jgi:hypothetical protein
MSSIKHTHTYVFLEKRNGVRYYKCDDPHCTHFASRKLIMGKASVCSNCRKVEIILNGENLRRSRPVCINCSNTAAAKEYRKSKELIETILKRSQQEEEAKAS